MHDPPHPPRRVRGGAVSACAVCERSSATGWTGGVAHCHVCHRSWTSVAEAHCVVCHEQFSSNSAADRHWLRHQGHVDPATVEALIRREDGVWTQPLDPDALERLRSAVGKGPNSPATAVGGHLGLEGAS